MKTTGCKFNRGGYRETGQYIEQPGQRIVANTMGLWNASPEDAARYGGELTRAALGAMNLRNDRKYITVDSKVHMLKPGFCPAIPGWHTDGAPRDVSGNPQGIGAPDVLGQESVDRPPRFHLLVTGAGCLTEFIDGPFYAPVPIAPSSDLYRQLSHWVETTGSQGVLCRRAS